MLAEWINSFDVFKEPFIIGICKAMKGSPKFFLWLTEVELPLTGHIVRSLVLFMKDIHEDLEKVHTTFTSLPFQLSYWIL